MRRLRLPLTLTALLLTLPLPAHAQWPTSPYRDLQITNVNAGASMCTDGAGGALFLWTGAYYSRYFQHVDSLGYKLLGEWGTPILVNFEGSSIWDFISDGQGGAFFIVFRYSTDRTLRVFRIDGAGNFLWSDSGIVVTQVEALVQGPRLIPDGSGGVVPVWSESVAWWTIKAQRIDSAGQILWPQNGVELCDSVASDGDFRITADGTGGAFAFYSLGSQPGEGGLFAQRVNGAGQVCWPGNGVPMLPPPQGGALFDAVSDDRGGAWISFWRYLSGYQCWLQHVDSTGRKQWPNGYQINPTGSSMSSVKICPDGEGGIYLAAWMHNLRTAHVNRMNYGGILLWGPRGVPAMSAPSPAGIWSVLLDSSGGVICLLNEFFAGYNNFFTQKISPEGRIVWDPRGVPFSLTRIMQTWPDWISDGSGGAIACWVNQRPFFPAFVSFAKHVDSNGHLGPPIGPAGLPADRGNGPEPKD